MTNNSVAAPFPQVISRLLITFVAFPLIKYVPGQYNGGNTWGAFSIFLCLLNWSLIEVVRFGFYTTKAFSKDGSKNTVADIFGHLRYNIFIFAYILGVSGELIAIFFGYQELAKLPYEQRPLTVYMPNKVNFVFDLQAFLFLSPIFYALAFPGLYMHMWTQRGRFYKTLNAPITTTSGSTKKTQ